jgi:hypothetical protein
MTTANNTRPAPAEHWLRIPNGTRVRHRSEPYEGIIDGLTEIVSGSERNPDGKTQYRVKVEGGTRLLVPEQHLNILTDANQLVLIGRESELYRRSLTDRLRAVLSEDRFVAATEKAPASRTKPRQ